ncbi:MAG: hypothetical protein R3B09_06375 [Nannocystaceae bacterium]
MTPGRALACWVLASIAGACVLDNQKFDPGGATTGGGESAASTTLTSAGPTGPASATSEASGTASTSSATASTSATTSTTDETSTLPTSTGASATSDASTGETRSGGPGVEPGTYGIPATVAACVLLDNGSGHGSPAVCGGNADAQNNTGLSGLMQIDTMVTMLDGEDRRAESFLRFDVPADYAGLVVADATLHVQVADGRGILAKGPQRGVLVTTTPFDEEDLDVGAPAPMATLADDLGPVQTDEPITWSIPVALVQAGAPLHLGLLPTDTDGVFYRGRDTPGAPTLEVVLVAP